MNGRWIERSPLFWPCAGLVLFVVTGLYVLGIVQVVRWLW